MTGTGTGTATFIIGVAGGSSSGKTDVCGYVATALSAKHPKLNRRMATISLTDFYRPLTAEEHALATAGDYNFDHPDAFDWKYLDAFLADVAAGVPAKLPQFDYLNKQRAGFVDFPPTDVILLEGILVLYKRKIRDRLAMMLFVDVDADVRLSATVTRDTLGQQQRAVKPLEVVLNQWIRFVKPSFEDFILPTKKYADVIIPRGIDNTVALDILVHHVDDLLASLAHLHATSVSGSPTLPANPRASVLTAASNAFASLALGESAASPIEEGSDESAPASPSKGTRIERNPLEDPAKRSSVYGEVPN
ncbi:P-loop containing nucleoside triphosphate hydrolase protein [Blastocladiella britannica]|nr:P-loop containing nucleoside triphosphate hydrolase protein [Blastocladiella britannica]